MKLAATLLVSSDVARLARFYKELTGAEPTGAESFQQLNFDGGSIGIVARGPVEAHLGGGAVESENHSLYLGFQVADVDAERERLRSFVPELVLEPTTQPWGNRTMIFRDPDGNLVNFFTPIQP